MAVFISHSHQDKEFTDKLALHLIKSDTDIWIDRWELHVGDSLINKIEKAIEQATAFVFVLSKASVNSNWCRKELTSSLIRELEQKKVFVLPILIEDCDIPLFLREKKYADFRENFDEGLREVNEALAKVTNDRLGRVDEPEWHTDWSTNWVTSKDNKVIMEILMVEQTMDQPYTVLSFIYVFLNEKTSSRHIELVKVGAESYARHLILEYIFEIPNLETIKYTISNADPVLHQFDVNDPKAGFGLHVEVESRRLGEDTGRDILLNFGRQFKRIVIQMRKTRRQINSQITKDVLNILKKYRDG